MHDIIRAVGSPELRTALFTLKAEGWSVSRTRNGHLKLSHPLAGHPVFSGSTPSDHRSTRNLISQCRNALADRDASLAGPGISSDAADMVLRLLSAKRRREQADFRRMETAHIAFPAPRTDPKTLLLRPDIRSSAPPDAAVHGPEITPVPIRATPEVRAAEAGGPATKGLVRDAGLTRSDVPHQPVEPAVAVSPDQGGKTRTRTKRGGDRRSRGAGVHAMPSAVPEAYAAHRAPVAPTPGGSGAEGTARLLGLALRLLASGNRTMVIEPGMVGKTIVLQGEIAMLG